MSVITKASRVRGRLSVPLNRSFSRYWIPLLTHKSLWPLLSRHVETGKDQVVIVVGPGEEGGSPRFWDYFLGAMESVPKLPWVAVPVWEPGVSSRWWHVVSELPAALSGWLLRPVFRRDVKGPDPDLLVLAGRTSGPIHIPASIYYGKEGSFSWPEDIWDRMVVWDDTLWGSPFCSDGWVDWDIPPPRFWLSSRALGDSVWVRVRSARGVQDAPDSLRVLPMAVSHTVFDLPLSGGFSVSVPSRRLPWWVRLMGIMSLWAGLALLGTDVWLLVYWWFLGDG